MRKSKILKIGSNDYVLDQSIEVSTVMNLSIIDGVLWSVYSTLASSYLIPLTIFILGSSDPVGIIMGIPLLIVPIAQFSAYRISQKVNGYRKITFLTTFYDRILWIPLVLLLFIIVPYYYALYLIIIILMIRNYFASFSGTTWTLWVPYKIPDNVGHLYFSKRNVYMKMASLAAYMASLGIFAMKFDTREQYLAIYIIALIFSSMSLFYLIKIPDEIPEKTVNSNLHNAPTGGNINFLFIGILSIISFTSSSFYIYFQNYLVNPSYLHASSFTFTLMLLLLSVAFMASQIIFGKITVKGKESRIILISTIILALASLVMLLSPGNYFWLSGILIGISQSGLGLSIFLKIIRAIGNSRKIISTYNLTTSLSQGIGPITLNFIINYTKNIALIFAISFSLSVLAAILIFIYTWKY